MVTDNNGKYKLSVEHRITNLENGQATIMNNHLPHIQKSVDKIAGRLWWLITLVVGALVAVVINLLSRYI